MLNGGHCLRDLLTHTCWQLAAVLVSSALLGDLAAATRRFRYLLDLITVDVTQ